MSRPLLFAVSLGFLLFGESAQADFAAAELRVNGLSCPFCAFGIEKKLLDIDGVQAVEVFLDEGRIALTFGPDNSAAVADFERAVEKAGFELAGLQLTVRGHLIDAEDGSPRLGAGDRMNFRLAEKRGEATQAISAATLERLRTASGPEGSSLVVTGAVLDRGEAEPTLVVESLGSPPQ